MCITLPGQVAGFHPDHAHLAEVLVEGQSHLVNVGMLEDEGIAPGDWVLIHAGCAVAKLDAEEAKSALDFVKALNQSFEDEFAVSSSGNAEDPPW